MSPTLARQQLDYLAGRNGLADGGPDDGPRLNPIPWPIWPPVSEDDMTPADIDKLADAVVDRLLSRKVEVSTASGAPRSIAVRQLLRELHQRIRKVTP